MSGRADSAGTGTPYVEEFDGLRGVAVFGVMLFHSKDLLEETPIAPAAHQGWAGVNLFFVLSGFLITSILLRSRDQPQYFRNFYARRALRIWPLYFALLLFSWGIAFALPLFEVSRTILDTPVLPLLLLVQNLFAISLPAPLTPTWTLAIEEQFYLAWAPLVKFARSRWVFIAAIAIIALSPVARALATEWLGGTHTLLNLDGLAFGALIAIAYTHARLRHDVMCALALAGAAGLCYLGFSPSPLLPTFLAATFAGIIGVLVIAPTRYRWLRRALCFRWLVGLGTISYGLYLLHGWASTVVRTIGIDQFCQPLGIWGDITIVIMRIAFSIAMAWASWIVLEKPALRLKKYFGRPSLRAADTPR
jgi:peptidoglycan/LPS O-acetylase OafA/YrhL